MNHYIENTSPERIAELQAVIDFDARLIRAASEAGVTIFTGTDAAFVPGLAPGLSLHEELGAMVAAGMSELDALEAATSVPAEWLGVAEDRGTVEIGKRANLGLLSADPFEDIANTSQIEAVFSNGQMFNRAALDASYAPYRSWFSPTAVEVLGN